MRRDTTPLAMHHEGRARGGRERHAMYAARAAIGSDHDPADEPSSSPPPPVAAPVDAARASEQRWAAGAPLGPLDGVPVSIKDLILTRGWPTLTCRKLRSCPTPPMIRGAATTARLS
jgi:aspartyl-tRNA(Asn)/glutamyl-tRNA(Gln) amidotransferase subunit A